MLIRSLSIFYLQEICKVSSTCLLYFIMEHLMLLKCIFVRRSRMLALDYLCQLCWWSFILQKVLTYEPPWNNSIQQWVNFQQSLRTRRAECSRYSLVSLCYTYTPNNFNLFRLTTIIHFMEICHSLVRFQYSLNVFAKAQCWRIAPSTDFWRTRN